MEEFEGEEEDYYTDNTNTNELEDDVDVDDDDKIAKQIFNAEPTRQPEDPNDDTSDFETDYGDEDFFQKIDTQTRDDFVSSFHPQLKMPSHDEIQRLTVLQKNEAGVIDDPFHRTEPFVRKYERTHIIGVRAQQLEHGAEPLIPFEPNMTEKMIATEEFEQKVLPFIIWRPFPDSSGEFWKLTDLEIIG